RAPARRAARAGRGGRGDRRSRTRRLRGRQSREAGRRKATRGDLGRTALGERLEPPAELFLVAAELLEPRQGGETLQPEDPLEERGHPVADGPATARLTPRLGDQPALDEAGDDRVDRDSAPARDLRPRARAEVCDDRERLERRLREAALDGPLEQSPARLGRIARGAKRPAASDLLEHDPAPPFAKALAEQAEGRLDALDLVARDLGQLGRR